jgi:hypothetical protein
MIFVAETEERSFYAFPTEAEAIAHCEGLDVEAGIWLFWDDSGNSLEPLFSVPNKRGLFNVANGIYSLVPAAPEHHGPLAEVLNEFLHFEAPAPFNFETGVRSYISRGQMA